MNNNEQEQQESNAQKSDVDIKYEQKMNQLVEGLNPGDCVQKEVFNTLSKIEDLTQIIDLFTGRFAQSQVDLLKGDEGEELI